MLDKSAGWIVHRDLRPGFWSEDRHGQLPFFSLSGWNVLVFQAHWATLQTKPPTWAGATMSTGIETTWWFEFKREYG
jgi:hypothetical protein